MGSSLRRLAWRVNRFARRRWRAVCRRLYRDPIDDSGRCVVVAGTARSGTTWLAEILGAELGSRILFEPFHPELVEAYRDYSLFQYLRPDADDADLERFVRLLVAGRLRHPWIDRQVNTLRPRGRVLKDVRACLLLGWLHRHFPEVPILFLVRHPCAVVASRMRLGWATDGDIDPLLAQPDLVEDHLADHLDTIRGASSDEEKHAVIWCIHHLVPLRQFGEGGLRLVFYEELCRDPEGELALAFEALGRRPGARALKAARRPSMTAVSSSAVVGGADPTRGWRKFLGNAGVERVLGVVEAFGLSGLYQDGMPQTAEVIRLRERERSDRRERDPAGGRDRRRE
jgi:hypothetical protein